MVLMYWFIRIKVDSIAQSTNLVQKWQALLSSKFFCIFEEAESAIYDCFIVCTCKYITLQELLIGFYEL